MMNAKTIRVIFCAGLILMVAAVCPLKAQQKLYLKDGSYQLVKSYKVEGNRVRYYSLERSEWEEVPLSLVDFKATAEAAKHEKAEKAEEIRQARQIENEKHEVTGTPGFQIQPGIQLPSDEGVYIFDGTQVLRLVQTTAEVVTDKKRKALMLAMPAPLLKRQSLVVLAGAKAAVRTASEEPVFYVEASDGWGANAELVPLQVHKDSRLVEKIDAGIGVGKSGEQRETIPVERKLVAPGIFRIKPTSPLKPGEYALGEMLGPDKLNLDLWTFGIDGQVVKTKK